MRTPTEKIRVQYDSYEGLIEEGFDPSDGAEQIERQFYAKFASRAIMQELTAKQRKIVILLAEGRRRSEIAGRLRISIQEVHQIIARIKRRIEESELKKRHMESVNNLVWWFYYYRNYTAKQMYDNWHKDTILHDYQRPSIITLRKWIKGYKE